MRHCSPAACRPASAPRSTRPRSSLARRASCSAPGWSDSGPSAGCRLQGAERIICVDLSEDRLKLAEGQGATDTWHGGPDTVQRVLDETRGLGADYTFEATGLTPVMRQAVEAARMGWGLCTIAGVAGKGETLDIVPRYLITGRRVCGSSFGGVKGRDQVPELVQLYARRPARRRPVHLTSRDARGGQRGVPADGAPGRDPQRDHVQLISRLWLRTRCRRA